MRCNQPDFQLANLIGTMMISQWVSHPSCRRCPAVFFPLTKTESMSSSEKSSMNWTIYCNNSNIYEQHGDFHDPKKIENHGMSSPTMMDFTSTWEFNPRICSSDPPYYINSGSAGYAVLALWTQECGENRGHLPAAAEGFPEKFLAEVLLL